jgi:outer membrane putative beta-barrel porin/alpha-amylase
MTTRLPAVIGLALAAAAGLACADDEIVADRPGFGESANVVARRHVQVEVGATWTRSDPIDDRFDAPRPLVRLGLGHSLELRVEPPDWQYARDAGVTASGWTDTTIGLKWHRSLKSSDLTLRATLVVPTGSVGFTDEDADPSGAVAWSRGLGGPWSIGATVAARHFRAYQTSSVSPSLSLGRSLAAHVGAFVEYGGTFTSDTGPFHQVDTGATWTPRSDTQLDLSFGFGLSPAATGFFVGVGVSRRF